MKNKLAKPTKTGFLAWAKRQPANRHWDYYDNGNCPFACYLKSLGYTGAWVGGHDWRADGHVTRIRFSTAIFWMIDRATSLHSGYGAKLLVSREDLIAGAKKV